MIRQSSKEDSLKKLMQQLSKEPSSILFAVIAEELRKKNRSYQALEICLKGTQRNPSYVGGWYTLGCIYLDLEQLHQAQPAFERVIALDLDHIKTYERLADIAIHQKKWQVALGHLNAIIQRYPLNSKAKQLHRHVTQRLNKLQLTHKNKQFAQTADKNNGFTKLRFRHKIIQNIRKLISRA